MPHSLCYIDTIYIVCCKINPSLFNFLFGLALFDLACFLAFGYNFKANFLGF